MKLRVVLPIVITFVLSACWTATIWWRYEKQARAKALYEEAFQLDHRGDFKGEIEVLRAAIRTDPLFMRSYYLLGRYLYFQTDQTDEAVAALAHPIRVGKDRAVAWQCSGFLNRISGARTNALGCFERALEEDPDYVEALFSLGSVLLSMKEFERAARANERAIQLDPNFSDAHSNLGVAYKGLGRTNDAIAADRAALAIRPDYASFHFNLGIHTAIVDPLSALKSFQEAVRLDASKSKYHTELAAHQVRMGNLTAAEKSYKEAVSLSRTDVKSREELAAFYEDTHRPKDALAVYQQIMRIDPDNHPARDRIAVLEGRATARESLILRRERSTAIIDWSADAHHQLAEAYEDLDDPRALAQYEAAVQLNPTSSIFRGAYAEALDRQGDSVRAEAEFRKAIDLDPKNLRAYDRLGLMLSRMGRFKDSSAVFSDMESHATSAPGIQDMARSFATLSDGLERTANATYHFTNAQGVIMYVPAIRPVRPGFDARDESTYGTDEFINLGTSLMMMQENERALHFLKQGLRAATNGIQRNGAAMKMAAIYRRTGQPAEGIKLYEALLREFPDDSALRSLAKDYRAAASAPASAAP